MNLVRGNFVIPRNSHFFVLSSLLYYIAVVWKGFENMASMSIDAVLFGD